eukprot:1827032-Pyramimonas_sp.AAC.1
MRRDRARGDTIENDDGPEGKNKGRTATTVGMAGLARGNRARFISQQATAATSPIEAACGSGSSVRFRTLCEATPSPCQS